MMTLKLAALASYAVLLPTQGLSAVLNVHLFLTGETPSIADGGFNQMAYEALEGLNALNADTEISYTTTGWVPPAEFSSDPPSMAKLDEYLTA